MTWTADSTGILLTRFNDANYFWVQTAPPRDGHTGAIAEGHYIIEDGTVTLTDVMASHFPVSNTSASLGPQMTKWLSLAAAA